MELTRREAEQPFDRLDAWYDAAPHDHAQPQPPEPGPVVVTPDPVAVADPAPAVGRRTQVHTALAKARRRVFGEA